MGGELSGVGRDQGVFGVAGHHPVGHPQTRTVARQDIAEGGGEQVLLLVLVRRRTWISPEDCEVAFGDFAQTWRGRPAGAPGAGDGPGLRARDPADEAACTQRAGEPVGGSVTALTARERAWLFAVAPTLGEHYRGNSESGLREEPASKTISQISPSLGRPVFAHMSDKPSDLR